MGAKGHENHATEPVAVDDCARCARSMGAGKLLAPNDGAKSMTDGLLTGLSVNTFRIIHEHVEKVFTG